MNALFAIVALVASAAATNKSPESPSSVPSGMWPDGKKAKIPEVRAIVDCNAKVAADAYWEIEKGLADDQGVSFRHMGHPGSYLALDADGFCNVVEDDGSADFAKRATWYDRSGHEIPSLHSFESCAEPGKFLRTRGRLRIDGPKTGGFRLDSTFEIVDR